MKITIIITFGALKSGETSEGCLVSIDAASLTTGY